MQIKRKRDRRGIQILLQILPLMRGKFLNPYLPHPILMLCETRQFPIWKIRPEIAHFQHNRYAENYYWNAALQNDTLFAAIFPVSRLRRGFVCILPRNALF